MPSTSRVLDINTLPTDAFPSNLTEMNGELYFTARGGAAGSGLWKTDGTAEGTTRVLPTPDFAVTDIINVNGTLFLQIDNPGFNTGWTLGKSDGTPKGTVPVRTIATVENTVPFRAAVVGDTLFFVWFDGTSQSTLWKSDGTAEGTVPLRDFLGSYQGPEDLTAFNGKLYFTAPDLTFGPELWTSDGTAEGTALLADINPGPAGPVPSFLQAAGAALYFAADDGTSDRELWSTDGTAEGTRMSKEIFAGAAGSNPAELTVATGRLFFAAEDEVGGRELWALELAGGAPAPGSGGSAFLLSRIGLIDLPVGETRTVGYGVWDFEEQVYTNTVNAVDRTAGALEPEEVIRFGDSSRPDTERRGDILLEGIPFVFTADME